MTMDLAREPSFSLATLRVDPSRSLVQSGGGREISLEPRVMQVLVTLAQAAGETVSRAELRDRCWDGRVTSDDAIDRVIARIRRLGEETGPASFAIKTIPRVGYRLLAAEPEPDPAEKSPASGPQWGRRLFLGGGAAAVGAAAFFMLGRNRGNDRADADRPLTVAVLPFRAIGGGPENEATGRRLSNELRAHLSRIREIRLIAETSSSPAAGDGGSARAIGERLGADLLVEGEVSGGPSGLRASAALIRASDQHRLWTEAAEAPPGDLTPLRVALAGALMQQIAALLPVAPRLDEAPLRRTDPQAYARIAEANRLLDQVRTASMSGRQDAALALGERAHALAREALAIDPQESGAWLVLAVIARNGWTPVLSSRPLSTQQRVADSIQFVRRALLADPSNPGALTQLGDYYRRYEFRWDEAETLFQRALNLNPSLVEAHWAYAYLLGTTGRSREGLEHAIAVYELDPGNFYRRVALPRLLYVAGQRAAALRFYDRELGRQPDNLFLLRELYFMYLSEGAGGDLQRLLAHMRRRGSGATSPEARALTERVAAGVEAIGGRPQRLLGLIDSDVASFDSSAALAVATPQGRARDDLPYIWSIEYAWAGAVDQSLDMLARALAAKSLYWPATLPFGVAPYPISVRAHRRFSALWLRDPGLRQLLARRRRALLTGQLAGDLGDGQRRTPALDPTLVAKVRQLLRRV